MKAVIIQDVGRPALTEIPEQVMRPDYIRVKTVAVAVNPTDFHHAGGAGRVGGILGMCFDTRRLVKFLHRFSKDNANAVVLVGLDLSGIVEEVGKDCKSQLKKGDWVYGVCHCANLNNAEDGAFAEYAMVRDGHIAKIPQGVSFDNAATLGVGLSSVGQALYMVLQLPLPTAATPAPFPILISGGSSATGTLAIQYAKLSGLTVIATASPKHFDLVKSRGADVVFNYHDPECGAKIREYTHNSLRYVFDTVCTTESFNLCAEALPTDPTEEINMVSLLPVDTWPRKDVTPTVILAYTTFGEAFTKFGTDFPPLPEHFNFGVMFWELTQKLLAEGKITPHPVSLRPLGLAGIPDGIAEFPKGTVSGFKLVYKVSETPDEVIASKGPALKSTLEKW
ncbi:hypothetical protein HYFRA_00011677 [Hymenoscyphus fraxineus]|uniref:Enoyl reductase (ER) domain-containing protein n=1 Tax=Hymenoscyphus fraxineus TaxID=746836 RepID=A0A9N9PUN1_9HELO|nr:hypothetical protein HYFRA_00011677 [Hymenoscyphus fraxineus]